MKEIKVLCIHGIGGKDATMNNQNGWGNKWKNAFAEMNFTHKENVTFMKFDSLFRGYNADLSDYWHFFETTFRDEIKNRQSHKGLIKYWFDNFPDMVVEFLLDKEEIRKKLRYELSKHIENEQPDIIFAHSLGSMMCYDYFTQPENTGHENITLVTAGSQLGNPGLKNHSLKQPLELLAVKFWYNLNNPKDKLFAKYSIELPTNKNYKGVETLFSRSLIHHDGLEYIKHSNAIKNVWNAIKNNHQ